MYLFFFICLFILTGKRKMQDPMVEITSTHPPAPTYLDELVKQAGDEEWLEALLIEVSSCNDQPICADQRAYHFAKEHHKDQVRKSASRS